MLKTKSKSSKNISRKKASETYSRELIEKVYKITYAMLKYKYRDNNYTDDVIVEMAVLSTIDLISINVMEVNLKNKTDDQYLLFQIIRNHLQINL